MGEWKPIATAPVSVPVELATFPAPVEAHVPNISIQSMEGGFRIGMPEYTHWRELSDETRAKVRNASATADRPKAVTPTHSGVKE
jgi:hypothetical protein